MMRLNYRHDRLEIKTENSDEERLIKNLVRLVQAVSNDLMAWYGDIEPEGSGYVITWRPKRREAHLEIKRTQEESVARV